MLRDPPTAAFDFAVLGAVLRRSRFSNPEDALKGLATCGTPPLEETLLDVCHGHSLLIDAAPVKLVSTLATRER
jgi:hypothetical protein